MKLLFFLTIFTLSKCSYTLANASYFALSLDLTGTSEVTNVMFTLEFPSSTYPIGNSAYITTACVRMMNDTYSTIADTNTLAGFAIQWACSSSCQTVADVYATVKYYSGYNFGFNPTTNTSSTTSLLSETRNLPYTSSSNHDLKQVYLYLTSLSSQNLTYLGLPQPQQVFHYRCYTSFNHSLSIPLDSAVADLGTTLGSEVMVEVEIRSKANVIVQLGAAVVTGVWLCLF
ncbi:unnamed protein product [Moneuplotes crassus]|uniref:Uncharacterized protein n=1 Tax=Euplotes crassus TaxID=5936 RepID=A0AAD1XWF8_EUPCR|nr:unnamed protein product [Moneuplotes crassus]